MSEAKYTVGTNYVGEVLIDWDRPERYVRLSPDMARQLAQHLMHHANKLQPPGLDDLSVKRAERAFKRS